MDIIFFGSDSFGIPTLESVLCKHRISAVVTAPDRKKGRGMRCSSTPIKEWAERTGTRILQPEKLTVEFANELASLKPHIILLISYGKRLPDFILEIPSKAAINLHPSLLPAWRGPAPIEWSLINGDTETGVTVMQMAAGIDEGGIIIQESCPIDKNDNIFSLRQKLAETGSSATVKSIELLQAKAIEDVLKPQQGKASHARKLSKQDGIIDWDRSARDINNLVRGLMEWPGARTNLPLPKECRYIKIFSASVNKATGILGKPGQIIHIDKDYMEIACNPGTLRIHEVQTAGRKRMRVSEFLRGCRPEKNAVLT